MATNTSETEQNSSSKLIAISFLHQLFAILSLKLLRWPYIYFATTTTAAAASTTTTTGLCFRRLSPVSRRRTPGIAGASFFYRQDAFPVTQPTAPGHWRSLTVKVTAAAK